MSDLVNPPWGDASDAELRELIATLINPQAAASEFVAKPQPAPFPGVTAEELAQSQAPVNFAAQVTKTLEDQINAGAGAVELQRRADAQPTSVDLRKAWTKRAMDISGQLGLTRQKNAMSVDNSQENCRKLVEHFFADRIWLDAFTQRILTTINWSNFNQVGPVRLWKDVDDIFATSILQAEAGYKLQKGTVRDAVEVFAHSRPRNSVVDWLTSLKWDGKRRLSALMPRVFGTPSRRYFVRAGRNLLISMVARAMEPGCKVDTMLVLEGPQGALKSTAWEVLGGERYAELTANPESKDWQQQLRGVWLGEMPELSALRRADTDRVKGMLTSRVDRYRPSYGHHEEEYPRQTVFVGTTNQDEWLRDATGNRRFIPIRVGKIDIELLRQERGQLFAEAVALYKARRKWWIYPPLETSVQQEARYVSDPWLESVRDALADLARQVPPQPITAAAVMDRMGIPVPQRTDSMAKRIGWALKRLGGQVRRRRLGIAIIREWAFPATFSWFPSSSSSSSSQPANVKPPYLLPKSVVGSRT